MSNEAIDIDGLDCLESGTLPVHGGSYSLVFLQPRHTDAIRALHETVIGRLPDSEKSFVLPRSEDYFRGHFTRGNGSAIMGVVCEGKLVAKCLIIHPDRGETSADLGGAILHSTPEDTSIMQSATVHPDFCRNGIMSMMINHWLEHALWHGRMHVLAEMETRNEKSRDRFLKAGLNIIGEHKSPVDGADIYNAGERTKYALAMSFTSAAQTRLPDGIKIPPQNLYGQKARFPGNPYGQGRN